MAPKHAKTNAVRRLESASIPHEVLIYDGSDGRIDAAAVAEKLGEKPGALFKTLVGRPTRASRSSASRRPRAR
jgi:Cys-tRNA(Pro)/Cys-tRNA(Cys) deacylase